MTPTVHPVFGSSRDSAVKSISGTIPSNNHMFDPLIINHYAILQSNDINTNLPASSNNTNHSNKLNSQNQISMGRHTPFNKGEWGSFPSQITETLGRRTTGAKKR